MAKRKKHKPRAPKPKSKPKAKTKARGKTQKQLNTFARSNPIKVITSRFRYIKLPSSVKAAVLSDVEKWYKHNGAVYTVERLKFVRQCLIRYMADGSLPPKHHDVWFQRNTKGFLKGHWATLFKLTHTTPQAVLKLVTCYTVFATDDDPSEGQIKKFKRAVEAPFSGNHEELMKFNEKLYHHSKFILRRYVKDRRITSTDVPVPGNYWFDVRANNDGHQTDMVTQITDLTSNRAFFDMVSKMPWVEKSLSVNLAALEPPALPPEWACFVKAVLVGQVNWINEPGMKERIVTDFKKPLEHLTMPLGKRLYEIVKNVPWDATFHEERGYEIIQQNLREGKTAYCFDLSKATDRFPFSTQFAVMLSFDFGPNYLDQLEILEYAVQGEAMLPNYERVRWAVGQPMGYYPSFAMFSLTHGMVLMQYLYQNGIEYRGQFVVHGDDLVIMDSHLAEFYKWFIGISGSEMNDFKSLVSTKFAEFNSRLVLPHGFITMRKWRPITIANVMDQIPEWGPKAIDWVNVRSSKKKHHLRLLLSTPGVLPSGNSVNPEGLTMQQRLDRVHPDLLSAIEATTSPVSNFISFRQLVLDRFRRNYFVHKKMILNDENVASVCDLLATNVILESHLQSLNLADILDRELLLDLYDFVDYCIPLQRYNNHILRGCADLSMQNIAALFLQNVGYLLAEFNDSFCNGDKLITFNFIKQTSNTRGQKADIGRLQKLLQVCKSIEQPFESAQACEL